MASNPATELASIIQSASIKRDPSPAHDINPSTAASTKIPAEIVPPEHETSPASSTSSPARSHSLSSASDDTIASDVIVHPRPRHSSSSDPTGLGGARKHLPLPDLRFEQTYLASIKNAENNWQVAYITIKDQFVLPLVQGIGYHLLISAWRHWNRGSKFAGKTLGARVRRWWWEVNNWKLPAAGKGTPKREFTKGAQDFYVGQFGSGTGD